MKHLLLVLFIASTFTFSAFAKSSKAEGVQGFVTLKDGVKRYVDYVPAKGKNPTIVLANGLVYELSRWGVLRQELLKKGYGVINYYMRGQFKTLTQEVKDSNGKPAFFQKGLEFPEMGEEINGILDALKITEPVVAVGLSYGASSVAEFVRLHPERVKSVFFMAPLVVPLDHYNPQGAWLYNNLEWIRMFWGSAAYDMAYDYIYRSYFNSSLIPEKIPEEMAGMEPAYKEAIFHLVRVTRDFDLRKYGLQNLPAQSVHFLLANEEEKQVFEDQLQSFTQTDLKARGSLVWLSESYHAVPDSQPFQAAEMITRILNKDRGLEANKLYRFDSKGLEEFKP